MENLPLWENGVGDGEEFSPAPAPGKGFLPVPTPVANECGEFSPLRGGAPTGSGNPRLIANLIHDTLWAYRTNYKTPIGTMPF